MDWQENLINVVIDKKVKGVIFDFDGTLANLSVDWEGLRNELKIKFDLTSVYLNDMLRELKVKKPEQLPVAYSLIENFEIIGIMIGSNKSTEEMLAQLQEMNIKTAIFSNNMTKTINEYLRLNNYNQFFELAIGKDKVENYKPDPEGVLLVLRQWGFTADEVLYVGNELQDMNLSEAAGTYYMNV